MGLFDQVSEASVDTASETPSYVPSYLLAADNHNIGNNNSSWLDPTTWDPVGKITGAGKLAATAVLSGANSFYNTGVAVNNWMGGTAEANETGAWISDIDSELGQYYKENKFAADLGGFIAGSLIPGLGGVKVFNMGQVALKAASSGWVGTNMGRAAGLLVPQTEKLAITAAAEIAQSRATFSLLHAGTQKALMAGVGQAALEGAAFEVAVAATMFKSPILENQDIGDIAKNIAIGAAFGGVVGGAFTAAKTYGTIKKAVTEADKLEKPFTHITELPGAAPADRVISRFHDLDVMKNVPIDETSEFAAKYARLSTEKETKLLNLAREDVHKMAIGGDSEIANMVADTLHGMDSLTVMSRLQHAKEIGRVSSKTFVDGLRKKAGGLLGIEEAAKYPEKFVKAIGEGAGEVYHTLPRVLNIADTVANEAAVLKKVSSYGFKESKPVDITSVKSHFEAEARYIWADKTAKLKDGMTIHENDLPLLEKALGEKLTSINVKTASGDLVPMNSSMEIFEQLRASKDAVIAQLSEKTKLTTAEIAKIANVKVSYVEGSHSANLVEDILARQDAAKKYTQAKIDKGLWSADKEIIDISTKPAHFKISYDTTPLKGMDGNVLKGMERIKATQKIYQQGVDNVFADQAGEVASRFWHPSEDLILQANRFGAGPGLVSFANGNYHSLESWAESIGSATNALMKQQVKRVNEALTPVAYKLANKPEAAIEFESINAKISATTEKYVLNEAGDKLIPKQIADYEKSLAMGKTVQTPKLQQGAPLEIPITHAETLEAVTSHIELKGTRTRNFQQLRNAQGLEDFKDASVFVPMRPNPKDYPHFAFVVDGSVTGVGHMSMIHAASERELEALLSKVPGNYKTITKAQSKEYHDAIKDFEYDRTLHENYIDHDMKARGINTPFFQKTDPQKIAADFMKHHEVGEAVFARELVNAMFEK
jgi:hypothetical protein